MAKTSLINKQRQAPKFKVRGYTRCQMCGRPRGYLRIYLRYGPGQERVITGLRRVSKPGRRLYVSADRIPSVLGGMGVAILSTPRGVLTDRESRRAKVGGEVLCYVW